MPALVFKRIQLFEFNDLAWLPSAWRKGITDAITFIARFFNNYGPVIPILKTALERSRKQEIVDLCSGSGGQIADIQRRLLRDFETDVPITLTDKYPNPASLKYLRRRSSGVLEWHPSPVEATRVPRTLTGFRTLFTSFHHFPPEQAEQILKSAVEIGQGIGIFDYTDRNLLRWIFPTIFTPPTLLLIAPFIRPFSLSRLLFTYLIPIIPLLAAWDCLISGLRTYLPDELKTLALETKEPGGLADLIAANVDLKVADKQELLDVFAESPFGHRVKVTAEEQGVNLFAVATKA